jgi:Protein of unknown function (DUF3302)/Barrel-sandwich domain of CusB or HlyD membrane-fusion
MSGLDIFAWIVLIILAASAIGVFCIAGWLPGHIAKTRGHPWAEAVGAAGWITLICGFALWPVALIWACVDVPAPRKQEAADGYVTNVALRKGARVANLPLAPVMAFIDTSNTLIGVELAQIDARYVAPGQPVEVTFKYLPGLVFTGKVETVLQAIATGQVQTSGLAVQSKGIEAAPFVARVKLDDAGLADSLPAGSTGTAAIFTDRVKAAHIIRKVLLRQIAITNYVSPF